MYELILVSESPRRRQILKDAGIKFRTDIVKISEIIEENVNLQAAIIAIAQQKSEAYLAQHKYLISKDILLLSADTVVCYQGRPYGKPKNSTEAQSILCTLSGQLHEVVTGFCITNLKTGEQIREADTTKVQFREMTDQEIKTYIATGEPLDKAGAYAIQGEGKKFVSKIEGSFLNVVGLPIEKNSKNFR